MKIVINEIVRTEYELPDSYFNYWNYSIDDLSDWEIADIFFKHGKKIWTASKYNNENTFTWIDKGEL